MKVGRDNQTKELIYAYTLPNGETVKLPAYRVFHIPGFSFDGIIGYDPIYLAREGLAMALALEKFGARFFGNGANPGCVLEHPNKLSKESQENLKKSWNVMHQGLDNQHRLAILEEGMTYKQVSIPNNNAQFLESKVFQIQEIARILHIPPHMLGELSRGTFSNIEHQGIEFVQYTMTPWFRRWENTCTRKLLLPSEKSTYFVEFLVDGLLRGDSAARAAFYKELFYLGALSPNDIREKENMNPITDSGGDKYYIQANMLPMDMAGQQSQQPRALNDTVRKIAERNKQNVLRAYEKDPDDFPAYLDDYTRDFQRYIFKEITDTK
jgi:HK97 family phage portal protein